MTGKHTEYTMRTRIIREEGNLKVASTKTGGLKVEAI